MQAIWDLRHARAKIALVVCGSVHSLMNRLFRDRKEPLYGRQTDFLDLRPFGTETLRSILGSVRPRFKPEDLLAFWALTGGVAKYVSLLADDGALSREKMIDAVLSPSSPFVGEGRAALVEEFGKDYGTYFSILSAIARGRTGRARIEQTVGREVGGYLTRLEAEYGLVAENELEERASFFEVKLSPSRFDPEALRLRTDAFLRATGAFSGYRIERRGLSPLDM